MLSFTKRVHVALVIGLKSLDMHTVLEYYPVIWINDDRAIVLTIVAFNEGIFGNCA